MGPGNRAPLVLSMADYIYLLQNRLTQAQRRAVEMIREAARAHTMPVFLVGGAARDLTSGTPVRDLDFALQGDASTLLQELESTGATLTGENPVLGAKYLLFPGGVRAELTPTQTVTYPKPGEPVTQPAAILDDLRRRDFTANAMAISLNEGSYGLLLDPLNGVADIENRELRLVSNYGFIEQPVLLLRIARLAERLGWFMEERTQARYNTAKEEGYIQALPSRDRGYELEEIFYEEDPLSSWEHLAEEGWTSVLYPAWTPAKADRDALEKVRDLMGQLEQMGIPIDPAPVYFPLLTAKMAAPEVDELKRTFVRPGFVAQIEALDARSKELGGQITGKSAIAPSETWKLLFSAEPEAVLWLAYSSRSGAVQAKFKAFLNEWPQMRQRVPYAMMQEMRITPDLAGYEQLLDALFFALLDGKLDTPEATRAFLEPYSPPAPVVAVSPRRRPAKAARSRSRKAAVQIAAVEADAGDEATEQPESAAASTQGETSLIVGEAGPESREDRKAKAKQPKRKGQSESKPPAPLVAASVTTSSAGAAAKATTAPAKSPTKVAAPSETAKKTTSPVTSPAEEPKVAPAAQVGLKKAAPIKPAAPAKVIANAPAKAVPARKGSTPPARTTVKTAAKKHSLKEVARVVLGNARSASSVAQTKSSPAKKTVPAKKLAPAKKAVKTAAKTMAIVQKASGKPTAPTVKAPVAGRAGSAKSVMAKGPVKTRPTIAPSKTSSPKKAAKPAVKGRR